MGEFDAGSFLPARNGNHPVQEKFLVFLTGIYYNEERREGDVHETGRFF